ncbi:MAG: tetratricopeptide repeat protein [Candidatus Omnitrophota bacterium]
MLGFYYHEGKWVKKNYEKAVEWYRLASKQGNEVAQYNLGLCYLYGDGVKKSKKLAIKWLSLATTNGHKKAFNILKTIK